MLRQFVNIKIALDPVFAARMLAGWIFRQFVRGLFSVFYPMLSCVKCNVKPALSVCKMDICCIKMKCQELGRSRASARSDKH